MAASNPLSDLVADLSPASQIITIKGKQLKISGLQSGQLADISAEYPGFGEFLNKGRQLADDIPDGDEASAETIKKVGDKININEMFALGGKAFPAIIAAGVGMHQDDATISMAASFAMEPQRDIVMHIMELTFPKDRRPPLQSADDNLEGKSI